MKSKRFFKIPFLNKYLIIGDGYPKKREDNYVTFIGFLECMRATYSTGLWTDNIDGVIDDIIAEYKFFKEDNNEV